ncbi:MAG TPA: alpha-ketoglutarate-dependent dioxygenase AlkB [Flavobacterium sp.]|uniref:alpha-ketoglutarate-dependent dioxygenase AlkB family protein n=1 Tax=Flavobacterium sp. TaxID=239 RepID=UPI002C7D1AD2|nr:alpha-ketoglutarate-dependent dioxygenase AlkB [Flavobacterium sp.]HSD14038.1 alpha-ketoglutarate-dependent dioxygenase AlkB [Flavobacterium sp.]
MDLFGTDKIVFDLHDAEIEYYPNFFSEIESSALFHQLLNEIPWQQDDITIFGKTYKQPRLTSFFGNEGKPYSYSNITMEPHNWSELLLQIKSKVEQTTGKTFSSVLLNLYRDGKDSNGWHADNEKELGQNPVIASVSFGEKRTFQLKHNTLKEAKQNIVLENGSLLLMKGTTQHYWKHQIPKTSKPINPRINLTFRTIL